MIYIYIYYIEHANYVRIYLLFDDIYCMCISYNVKYANSLNTDFAHFHVSNYAIYSNNVKNNTKS